MPQEQLPDATKRLAPQELTILVYETIDVFLCTSTSNSHACMHTYSGQVQAVQPLRARSEEPLTVEAEGVLLVLAVDGSCDNRPENFA